MLECDLQIDARFGPPNQPVVGGLAQLGERLHGMQEVMGSSPLSSTFVSLKTVALRRFSLCFC
jgi:hypothetical protein